MDKRKIVFIVDDGLPSGGLYDALKAMGEQLHVEVEMMEYKDILQGINPKMAIWDEGLLPVPEHIQNLDFTALEQRCIGLADAVLNDGTEVVYKTGRKPSEPELQYLLDIRPPGKTRLQQDIYTMIATQLDKNRDEVKDLFWPIAYGTGRVFGNLQQIPRNKHQLKDYGKLAGFPSFEREHTVGADHPSRKREPKGPRGKWGRPQ